MADITGPTVYVLGAGASHHTGAPLLRDFLVKARMLRDSARLLHPDAFDRVFTWVDTLRASSYYVDSDLDNLEHVFSLAELGEQLALEAESPIFRDDLPLVIAETLDSWQLRVSNAGYSPDPTYAEFVRQLQRLGDERRDRIRVEHALGEAFVQDSVITFNYDIALDHAMRTAGAGPEYLLERGEGSRFALLKLHGSLNWGICRTCTGAPMHVQEPIPPVGHRRILPGKQSLEQFAMATKILPSLQCASCKTESLRPALIPPTWSKAVRQSPFAKVWKEAVARLRNAFQIVVIGYSMPTTDTFFQYLLTLGLSKSSSLNRVVVVDVDRSETFRDRYRRVFSRSLDARGRLVFLDGMTFESFVASRMELVASDSRRPPPP